MGYLRYSRAISSGPVIGAPLNGGRSQTNFGFLFSAQGDHPFINVMKLSPIPIVADRSDTFTVTPDLLNADGYPLATGTHTGYMWVPIIPNAAERPGNWICTWDGTGTVDVGAGGSQLGIATFSSGSITGTTLAISGLSGTIQPGQRVVGGTVLPYTFIMSGSGTTWTVSKSQSATGITGANGGSFTSSGGAGAGFCAITTNGTNRTVNFIIRTVGSPIITNVQLFHVDDAAIQASGEIFGTLFLSRLREANFGVLRFLNWHINNTSNMTTWRTRKPVTYATYVGDQLNNSFYAGTATHTGNAYVTTQFPAIHSSDGTAWSSGGPKDRDTIHVNYTNTATTGTCTLSVGTSGVAINILNAFGGPLNEGGTGLGSNLFYPIGGGANSLSTLIYDVSLSGWIMHGGCAAQSGVGISNGAPFETCVQLCKEVGAHPYFLTPYLSIDPATDLMAELAQYCKTYAAANAPWMIPRFEGPNETWNGNTYLTGYCGRKAVAHWGSGSYVDGYGKWLANLGQICAGVYGLGNLAVTYQVLCGVQTALVPSTFDERLNCTKYLNGPAADPAITGLFGTITFSKVAAKTVTSTVANAQYINGAERFDIAELVKGYNYSVTNKGNSSAQATLANSYCDSLTGSASSYGTLLYWKVQYEAYKAWGAALGVNKMCGYEGCWSPDFIFFTSPGTEADCWWSDVTGRTQANPAIMQLTSTCHLSETSTLPAGNPGVVGMAVTFNGTSTQFDNPGMFTRPVTFSGSTVSGTNTLVVNQAVFFRTNGGTLPTGTGFGTASLALSSSPRPTYSETFYVVAATSTTCQISASRGGPAITFATVGSGGAGTSGNSDGIYMQEAWFITGVDSVNNRVTLDCNSTAFTAPTTGTMSYCKSMVYSNNIRQAGKLSPNLQTHTITNYTNFTNAGGEYPSNYLMAGDGPISGNVWNVLEPLNQSPNPPQWLAFISYNH